MTSRRDFLRTAGLAAGAAALGSRARAATADPVTIVLPLGFAIDFFDTMNAYSGGHFKRFGIDAKVIGANTGVQTIQLVASGQAMIGRGAPADIIRAVAANQPAPVAICSIFQGCPFRVFSRPEKPIREPKDFAGKTVGLITLASPTGIYLDAMLAAAGLKPSDVEREATGGTPGAWEILKQGRVDGFVSTTSVETALKRANTGAVVLNPDPWLPLPGQTYYAMRPTLEQKGDLLVRLLKAEKASIDEMLAGPLPPLIQRAAKDFEIPGVDDLALSTAMLEATISELLLPQGRDKLLLNLPERWAGGVAALAKAHIVEVKDPTVLYTNEFVEQALKA
jgi:ABC-type nitrate/sulfonate/bicarbonate transport system substrate-binding protein